MCQRFVAYFRVSTARQGKSGLGLAAQKEAAAAFIASKGADAKLLSSYVEVESGKRADRPQLAAALEQARLTDSVLLIAKLDRLSRDAHFLLGLQKAGVRFIAADLPEANEMVVGLMAVIAQAERKLISQRTIAALKAAKARGQKLGNPNGAAHLRGAPARRGNRAATKALTAQAQQRAAGLAATIGSIKAQGITAANAIARELNARHIATPRGGAWSARSVLNMTARL